MDENKKKEILTQSQKWMRNILIKNHISNTTKLGKVKELQFNPFLIPYLANYFKGNTDYSSLAAVLLYPRILGTSINTTFGNEAQKLVSVLLPKQSFGSVVHGMDIEFTDQLDGRRKYCQIKAGPNSLNKDDVATIEGHFNGVLGLAKTNSRRDIRHSDLVFGVLYGEPKEMNANIKAVAKKFTVYSGKTFWHHLTGDEDFYEDLALAMAEVAEEYDMQRIIKDTLKNLAEDLKAKYPDLSKSKKL
jgi:hypothetical protein